MLEDLNFFFGLPGGGNWEVSKTDVPDLRLLRLFQGVAAVGGSSMTLSLLAWNTGFSRKMSSLSAMNSSLELLLSYGNASYEMAIVIRE
jgi:hypothetical protein